MLGQLPPVPDEAPLEEWYYQEETRLVMQQSKWFDFKFAFGKCEGI